MTEDEAWRAEVEAWHAARDARLRAPDGWLTLVGLYWLTPGEHEIGQHPSSAIRLGGLGVPPLAGHLLVTDDLQASIRPHHSAPLSVDGQPISGELPLLADTDTEGDPTVVELGSLRMHLIRRGPDLERLALRVRDTEAPALAAFRGVPRFAVDPAWRVIGHLERPAEPRTIAVPDVVGDVLPMPTPGDVILPLPGGEQRLHALEDDGGALWLIFADATSGTSTFGGGRFLTTDPVQADDTVVVDFNLARNPPCVFSPHATCPLPPAGNSLLIPIPAGEMLPEGAHSVPPPSD